MADAYQYIDKQTLDLIKYPPPYSPIVSYGSDYNYSSNKLRGKLYQFCYRYIYDTKMKSVFSPYSEVAIPQGEELPNGDFIPDFHLNNFIAVRMLRGHHTVDEIEVAYRIGNEGTLYVFDRIKAEHPTVSFSEQLISGIIYAGSSRMDHVGDWGGVAIEDLRVGMSLRSKNLIIGLHENYIISIDVANKTIYLANPLTMPESGIASYTIDSGLPTYVDYDNYVYAIFRNDTVDYAVPSGEEKESFDAVPLTARAMEIIESNRIVAGGVKTGFDNTVLDVEAVITNTEVSAYHSKYPFPKLINNNVSGVQKVFVKFPDTFSNHDYLYISIVFQVKSSGAQIKVIVPYLYTTNNSDTTEEIVDYFVDAIEEYNNTADVDTGDADDYNFKVRTLVQEATEFPINAYSSSATYFKGAIVSYNTNYYVALGTTTNNTPSGSTSNTDHWEYLCPIAERDRVLVLRLLPLGSPNTTFLYELYSFDAAIYTLQQTYSKFKDGHKINVAIEYLDYACRPSAANESEQLEIDIPALYSIASTPSTFSYNNIINEIELHIKNRPPEWAYYYRILIDRNVPWFFQFFFNGPANDDPDITDANIHWHININRAIQNLRDYLPKAILSPYLFEKGDRIRILAFQNTLDLTYSLNRWRKYNLLYDAEIIGYDYPEEASTYMKDDNDEYILDGKGNKVREVSTGYIITEKAPIDAAGIASAIYLLYEIYRPRKVSDENTSYWETSETLAIFDPGSEERRHKGDQLPTGLYDATRDQWAGQLATHPAKVKLNSGNVYRKMRYSGEADIYFPVESLSLSDFYESNAIGIGRTNVISRDLGQIDEENAYMWSDILLEDTAINKLNKFPLKNKARLQSKHGAITAFKEKGFILYAWQTNKVTSIYIGRSSMVDPSDGSERVNLISNAVFGTVRPASSEYGCSDPKSISDSQVHIYFWDDNNSKWLRIAYNGNFPVSDYGMNKFYNDINALMKLSGNKHSISVYDNKYDELVVSHKYIASDDYTLSVIGQYAIGDNKLIGIGRSGGDLITSLEEGMILTQLSSSEVTPEINLTILKIDTSNRIIYLDQVIPFTSGITGPVTITAQILKKYNYKTIAFNEPVNAWKTRYPFPPELMVAYGDQILSFLNGKVYWHDSDQSPYNFFYGIQFEQYFQFVFNADATMVKLLEGIEYIATKKFGAIDKGDITVKAFDARGVDMESRLPIAKFRNVEGKWVSEFLRDMNTPGYSNENYALTDGRFLRGQACIIKFTNFETVKTVLYEVSIYFNQSL